MRRLWNRAMCGRRISMCGYISVPLTFLFVCLCVWFFACVCTVTNFSEENKASGVKFCTAVYQRPRQGSSILGNFPPLARVAQNRTIRPARGPPPRCLYQLLFGSETHDSDYRHLWSRVFVCQYAIIRDNLKSVLSSYVCNSVISTYQC